MIEYQINDTNEKPHRSQSLMKSALAGSFLFILCAWVSAADKPDVLVILADQWSPRYTSWDNKEVRTPHLDSLAREGMIFDACYTTSPVCMPARVSLLTGLYPHNAGHGLWGNAAGYYPQPKDAPMFLDIQRAGWTTAQIGKTLQVLAALGCSLDITPPPDSKGARKA